MSAVTKKNSASSRIVRALGIFSGVKIVVILCSLIRNKLIAWFIGPAGLGLVGLYNGLMDLISQSSRLSMDQSAQRDISQSATANADVTITVVRRWALWLGLSGSLLTCLLSPVLSLISFDTTAHWPSFCLLAVVPFFYTSTCCINAENQGLRRFRAVALSTLLGNIVALVLAVPLILFLGLKSIVWIIALYAIVTGLFALYFQPRISKIILPRSEIIARGRSFIKIGAQITLAMIVTQAATYAFILFLNNYASTDTLGIYQAGHQIMNSYVGIIFTVLWIEYYPRLSSMAHSPRRLSIAASHQIRVVLLALTPLLCLLIVFVNPGIRLIYASTFLGIIPYIVAACIGVVFRTTSYCLAYVVLARGDGRTYMGTEITSSIVGLILNISGFVVGGFLGLGIAYIAWYAFYTALMVTICRRKYGVTLNRRTWLLVVVALVLIAAVAVIYLIASGII